MSDGRDQRPPQRDSHIKIKYIVPGRGPPVVKVPAWKQPITKYHLVTMVVELPCSDRIRIRTTSGKSSFPTPKNLASRSG